MYSLNSFLGKCFEGYKANRADKHNLALMYAMDDRQLSDIGVTRGDLKFQSGKAEAKIKRRAEKLAIKELRAMSDAELHDLGITRGNIVEAVRYGRTGLEEQPMPANKVLASNLEDIKSVDAHKSVNSGLVVVGGSEEIAVNSDTNDNAPKPPRTPLNRPAAA